MRNNEGSSADEPQTDLLQTSPHSCKQTHNFLFQYPARRFLVYSLFFLVIVEFHCTADRGRGVRRFLRPEEEHRARGVRRFLRTQRSSSPLTRLPLPATQLMGDSLPPPYLRLPVFVDSLKPLLDPEHFHPSAGTGLEPLPDPIRELLRTPEPTEPQPEASVRIDCKHDRMFVEVDRAVLGSDDQESALRLGSCTATKATEEYVYFENKLNKCGTRQTVSVGKMH
ncbi:hypothetical protein WMY93_025573 [Mugilogobius chulae]|uniref:ZP domain-containing protein n=1 Tax=Mugilogobius chulae TaxID=88201 RepID=A0AAW0N1R4_9GOBI